MKLLPQLTAAFLATSLITGCIPEDALDSEDNEQQEQGSVPDIPEGRDTSGVPQGQGGPGSDSDPRDIFSVFKDGDSHEMHGVTHTVSQKGNTYSITFNGTHTISGEVFDNWVAFTYQENPSADVEGIFTAFFDNTDTVSETMTLFTNGSEHIKVYTESGEIEFESMIVNVNDSSFRMIMKDSQGASAMVIDEGEETMTMYEGCTAEVTVLAGGDFESCATANTIPLEGPDGEGPGGEEPPAMPDGGEDGFPSFPTDGDSELPPGVELL